MQRGLRPLAKRDVTKCPRAFPYNITWLANLRICLTHCAIDVLSGLLIQPYPRMQTHEMKNISRVLAI
jgi:hypothetical protein